jgi:hypothetical protein
MKRRFGNRFCFRLQGGKQSRLPKRRISFKKLGDWQSPKKENVTDSYTIVWALWCCIKLSDVLITTALYFKASGFECKSRTRLSVVIFSVYPDVIEKNLSAGSKWLLHVLALLCSRLRAFCTICATRFYFIYLYLLYLFIIIYKLIAFPIYLLIILLLLIY